MKTLEEIKDHVDFITGRLAPDLRDAGHCMTADDLELSGEIIRQLLVELQERDKYLSETQVAFWEKYRNGKLDERVNEVIRKRMQTI